MQQRIEQNWRLFFDAWVQGDATRCADFFCEDAIHLRPAAGIDRGKAQIQATFSRMLANFQVEYCRQTCIEVIDQGALILECGTYEQKWRHQERAMSGGYIAVWQRNVDKLEIKWLIFN
jgi:ketosteroid isomerase-like protein